MEIPYCNPKQSKAPCYACWIHHNHWIACVAFCGSHRATCTTSEHPKFPLVPSDVGMFQCYPCRIQHVAVPLREWQPPQHTSRLKGNNDDDDDDDDEEDEDEDDDEDGDDDGGDDDDDDDDGSDDGDGDGDGDDDGDGDGDGDDDDDEEDGDDGDDNIIGI